MEQKHDHISQKEIEDFVLSERKKDTVSIELVVKELEKRFGAKQLKRLGGGKSYLFFFSLYL